MFYLLTRIKIQSSFKNKNRITVSKESQERDPWQKELDKNKIQNRKYFPIVTKYNKQPLFVKQLLFCPFHHQFLLFEYLFRFVNKNY